MQASNDTLIFILLICETSVSHMTGQLYHEALNANSLG